MPDYPTSHFFSVPNACFCHIAAAAAASRRKIVTRVKRLHSVKYTHCTVCFLFLSLFHNVCCVRIFVCLWIQDTHTQIYYITFHLVAANLRMFRPNSPGKSRTDLNDLLVRINTTLECTATKLFIVNLCHKFIYCWKLAASTAAQFHVN